MRRWGEFSVVSFEFLLGMAGWLAGWFWLAGVWTELTWTRVYAELRSELWGEALTKFRQISYVHGRLTSRPAKLKL